MVFLEIISQLCNFNPRSREGSDFLYFSSFSMPALNFNPRSREGRSEVRRVGKECLALCIYRWAPYH